MTKGGGEFSQPEGGKRGRAAYQRKKAGRAWILRSREVGRMKVASGGTRREGSMACIPQYRTETRPSIGTARVERAVLRVSSSAGRSGRVSRLGVRSREQRGEGSSRRLTAEVGKGVLGERGGKREPGHGQAEDR